MITGRRLEQYNTGSMTRRTDNLRLLPEETLDLSPADAVALGVVEGQTVEVMNRRGSMALPAHVTVSMS